MNIAELFISIGVKGTDKVLGALGDANKQMSELGSTSLATKAAIVGAFYAIERTLMSSGMRGIGLKNLAAISSMDIERIQMMENAFRKVGMSASDTDNLLMNMSKTIARIRWNDPSLPKYLPMLLQEMHADRDTLVNSKMGPAYLANLLSKAAKNHKPEDITQLLSGLGIEGNALAGVIRNKEDLLKYRDNDIIRKPEIDKNEQVGEDLLNFENNLKLIRDNLTATFGGEFSKGILNISESLKELVVGIKDLNKEFPEIRKVVSLLVNLGLILAAPFLGPLGIPAAALGATGLAGSLGGDDAEKRLLATGGPSGTLDRLKNNKLDIIQTALKDALGAFSFSHMTGALAGHPSVAPSVKPTQSNHYHEYNISAPMTLTGDTENPKEKFELWSDHVSKTVKQMPSILRTQ